VLISGSSTGSSIQRTRCRAKWSREALKGTKDAILEHAAAINRLFVFYSAATADSTTNVFTIDSEGYTLLLSHMYDDERQGGESEMAHLRLIFTSVNAIQQKDEVVQAKKNDKDKSDDLVGRNILTLNRYEILEWIVRAATIRYPERAYHEAVRSFLERDVMQSLTKHSVEQQVSVNKPLHDANTFRLEYCYPQQMCEALKEHQETLKALFAVYSIGDGDVHSTINKVDRMSFEEFMDLLEELDWAEELTFARITLMFGWCRMLVVDEYRDLARNVQICFEDFLELIVRIASLKALPTQSDLEMREDFDDHPGLFVKKMQESPADYEAWSTATEAKQFASGATAGPMPPIWERVRILITMIIFKVQDGAIKPPRYPDVKLTKDDVVSFRKRGLQPERAARADGEVSPTSPKPQTPNARS